MMTHRIFHSLTRRLGATAFAVLLICGMGAGDARADCANPTGIAGAMVYNSTHSTVQFCNGTNWIRMGGSGGSSGSSTLATLTDVTIGTPTNGQALVYNSTSSKWEPGTVSGGGSGTQVAFSAHKNGTSQSVSGSWVTLTWSTELFDVGNNLNAGAGVFTAPSAGKYMFVGEVYCPNGNSYCAARLIKNGATVIADAPNQRTSSTDISANVVSIVELAANDTIVLQGINSGGTTVGGGAETTYFQGFSLGNGGGSGSSTLAGLTDINYGTPTNGQALVYNSTSSKWEPGTVAGGGGGANVVTATKTDAYSHAGGTTWTDIPGLSVTITPGSSGSKIILTPSVSVGATVVDETVMFRLVRGSTPIGIGDTASARAVGTFSVRNPNVHRVETTTMQFVDSPATTSATTYKVQMRKTSSYTGTPKINTSGNDGDYDYTGRTISTLTAMEAGSGGGGGSATLAGLTDVTIGTPTNGQSLVYNSTSSKWEPGTVAGGSGTQYGFVATASSASISASNANVTGLTEDRDDGNVFNPTTGIFTAPVAGYYTLSARMSYVQGGSNFVDLSLKRNGTTDICRSFETTNNGNYFRTCAAVAYLATNDQIAINTSAQGGATTAQIYFSGASLGGGGGGGSSQWTTATNDVYYNTGGVTIGGATIADPTSVLDLRSTTKGFLPPRMTTAQRNAISSPAEGLMVYNTDTKSFDIRTATSWLSFSGSQSGATMVSGWPDTIFCDPYVLMYWRRGSATDNRYVDVADGSARYVSFNDNGTYNTALNGGVCASKSIAQLYSEGRAFNFVGGGGSASASGAAGAIQFAGASNAFAADATALFWDNVSKRLGVGTTPATYALEVSGNGGTDKALVNATGGTAYFGAYGAKSLVLETNGAARLTITSAGAATFSGNVTAVAYLYSSDLRLKDGVTPIESALSRLTSINGVTFTFKDDAGKRKHLGVIAQDVEKVFPEAVITGDDGMKKVDYPALIGPMIEAIKELKAENDNLKARIDALETKSNVTGQ